MDSPPLPPFVTVSLGRQRPGDVGIPDIRIATTSSSAEAVTIARLENHFKDEGRPARERPHTSWILAEDGTILAEYQMRTDGVHKKRTA